MNTKHTPEPCTIVVPRRADQIALSHPTTGKEHIVPVLQAIAAPELLAALEHIEGHWAASEQMGDPAYALDLATCDECRDMARAAIAKATGQE
jgi:hypothetical protein